MLLVKRLVASEHSAIFSSVWYWVTQNLPQICIVILRICIRKVA